MCHTHPYACAISRIGVQHATHAPPSLRGFRVRPRQPVTSIVALPLVAQLTTKIVKRSGETLRKGPFVVLLVSLAGAAVAAAPRVALPRDHAGHPRAGIEWWYVTGDVRGADGVRYSVFFTLFSRQGFVILVSQVLSLDTGALVGKTELLAQRTPGTRVLDVRAPGHRLLYLRRSDTWRFIASKPGFALDLTVKPTKPYVLHGDGTGVIEQSAAGQSAYYSATRTRARGAITTAGTRIRFTGEAWLDHQWGDFADDPRALNWDWFSCRFADRTELMLYRFRKRDGTPLLRYRSGTLVGRDGRGRLVRTFDVNPGARVLDAAGRRWPLDWQLRVPSARLTLSLRSLVDDQLVRGQVLPTFWEGAAEVTGSKRGVCFVEQSYARRRSSRLLVSVVRLGLSQIAGTATGRRGPACLLLRGIGAHGCIAPPWRPVRQAQRNCAAPFESGGSRVIVTVCSRDAGRNRKPPRAGDSWPAWQSCQSLARLTRRTHAPRPARERRGWLRADSA